MWKRSWSILVRYLRICPRARMLIEWPVIILVGIAGEVFAWPRIPFSPYTNVVGGGLLLTGWLLHVRCHRAHRQGHEDSSKIENIVTEGAYSRIRHPMYLSLVLIYFGAAFAWGVVWILLPVCVVSLLTMLTAVTEERLLLERFPREYGEYMQAVPWRFFPGLF